VFRTTVRTSSAVRIKHIVVAAMLATLAACGSDEGDGPNAPQGDFTVALNPAALAITQGQNAQFAVTATRTGGFAGAIAGTAEGAPAGVTLSPIAIAAGSNSAQITATVAATTTPGAYPITIRTTATGITQKTSTLTLTVNAAATPAMEIALTPAALAIAAGAQGTSNVNITRSGGFAGAVTLALQGNAPAGITVTLPAGPVAGNTAAVNVAVGAQVAAGNYPITINATGTGVAARTAVLTVTVTAPNLGNFTLAANPAAVSVTQGQSTQTTITVNRVAPHVAPVTLAITGLPAGVTATVNPSPIVGNTATVTFTAAAGATVGAGTANIVGTGGNVTSAAINVAVTVAASQGGGGGNVTFTFCEDTGLPVFVAYQDGNGAWTRANAAANNAYAFNIASGRGGVAYVTNTGGNADLTVQYGSTAELNALGTSSCGTAPATGRTFTGSVAGMGPMDFVSVVAGNAFATVTGFGAPTYTLENVAAGAFDLLATRFAFTGGAGKFIIRRNLNPANNSALPVLDFNGPEAFDPVQRTVTVNNSQGQELTAFGLYILQGGSSGGLYFSDFEGSTQTTRNWYGVPNDKRAAGDFHLLFVNASTGVNQSETRSMARVFREATNQTYTLPAALTSPTITSLGASGGNSRVRAVYTPQADYGSQWSIGYAQNNGANVSISVNSGYAAGGAITIDVPDLTGLAGWNTNWGLRAGLNTTWQFSASGWDASFNPASPGFTDGAVVRSASKQGVVTP
jgi:hypothetical protein